MNKIVCDLDNSLLNTLLRLEEIIPNYSTSKQRDYNLSPMELLPFIDGSVYKGVQFNDEVVDTLIKYIQKGYQPIFISQTFTKKAERAKRGLIKDLHKKIEEETDMKLKKFKLHTGKCTIVNRLKNLKVTGDLVFIDDAPKRLSYFQENFPNAKVYRVTYPYNKDIGHNNMGILNSNHYKIKRTD